MREAMVWIDARLTLHDERGIDIVERLGKLLHEMESEL
jgi:hypothetical protein